MTGPDSMVN